MSTYRNKIKELLDAKNDIERQSSALSVNRSGGSRS